MFLACETGHCRASLVEQGSCLFTILIEDDQAPGQKRCRIVAPGDPAKIEPGRHFRNNPAEEDGGSVDNASEILPVAGHDPFHHIAMAGTGSGEPGAQSEYPGEVALLGDPVLMDRGFVEQPVRHIIGVFEAVDRNGDMLPAHR